MKGVRILYGFFACFMLSVGINYGQVLDYGSTSEQHIIEAGNNFKYKLRITLPVSYDKSKEYHVLYYTDAWWLSEVVQGSYALLDLTDNIEDIILVGISLEGNSLDWNTQRSLDFTPSNYDLEKMRIELKSGMGDSGIDLNAKTTGGADDFISFLERKVFKYVEGKYPNLKEGRGYIGHSFGGLFGTYVMMKRPDMFTHLVLISPSLWWNKSELMETDQFLKFKESQKDTKLFLTYGGAESNWITKSNKELDKILVALEKENLKYTLECYEKSNHNSILPRAIYDGLEFLYGKKGGVK